jgi:hypothetical protein
MTRPLREDERDEIESVKYLIKSVLFQPNVENFRIWEAVLKLKEIGEKYVISEIVTEEEIEELMEFDDMMDLMQKLLCRIESSLISGASD